MNDKSLLGIPTEAIPPAGKPVRQMLDLFLMGDEVPEQHLCDQFGRNYRSLLQRLRGDAYLNWRFIDVIDNGTIEARYLDPRHLSQDRRLDALARAERKKELKAESHKEAMEGASRIQVAFEEFTEASEKLCEMQVQQANSCPICGAWPAEPDSLGEGYTAEGCHDCGFVAGGEVKKPTEKQQAL